jgi:hypothetical protein
MKYVSGALLILALSCARVTEPEAAPTVLVLSWGPQATWWTAATPFGAGSPILQSGPLAAGAAVCVVLQAPPIPVIIGATTVDGIESHAAPFVASPGSAWQWTVGDPTVSPELPC